MDDSLFSLPVNIGIPSKEDSVAALRSFWYHTVWLYKTLTLEEVINKSLMKGNNKGRQSLLAHFSQDHDFQQQQLSLPVKLHPLAHKQ